jgi:probable HAF family extracellular repeat protein
MRSLKTFFLLAAAVLLVITASANADRQLIDLGTLGGTKSYAHSINDNGQIVGSAIDASGYMYPCLFDSTGGKANINIAPKILGSRQPGVAYSINNNGQIVGCINSEYAYLFDSTGGGAGTNLGTLPGFNYSTARAINDNGWIVGDGDVHLGHAGRFCPSPMVDLGTLGGSASYAYAINNNGKIVGSAYTNSSIYHATLFDSTGGGLNLDLGTIAGYINSNSSALSINNLNHIVGCARNSSSDCYSAVLFDSTGNGANINLGALNSYYNSSKAWSINDRGQIVGYSFWGSMDPLSGCHAVLFDSTGGGNNIDLNTLIAPSSWTLSQAFGINNNGWIVGDMTNSGGTVHAFLLTPEPVTVLLFAFGGVAILRKRRA